MTVNKADSVNKRDGTALKLRRVNVTTVIRHQEQQNYCTWPGGPGCESLGQNGECCGRYGWRTIEERQTEENTCVS